MKLDFAQAYAEYVGDDFPAPVGTGSQWWLAGGVSPVCAYSPKGAADLASSYSNLNDPGTNDALVGVAPTWNAVDGWKFDGSSQYLYTQPIDGGGVTVIVRANNIGSGSGRLVGTAVSTNSNPRLFIIPFNGTTVNCMNGSTEVAVSHNPRYSNVYAIAGNQAYHNGVNLGMNLGAWSGTNTNPLAIGGQKTNTGANNFRAANVQAFALYNTVLTDAQIRAISVEIFVSQDGIPRNTQMTGMLAYCEVEKYPVQMEGMMGYFEISPMEVAPPGLIGGRRVRYGPQVWS